ncbi:MAG: PEP-CTERM system histidine kinase PrsK [Rhodospirillales bacterium]|nr:MAG: PEP-CTERM system histidine kinase PrsK [Rhodospirillales bacterium]
MLIYDPEKLRAVEPPGAAADLADLMVAAGNGFSLQAVLYGLGAVTFAALGLMLMVRAKRKLSPFFFAVASLLTAGWLGTVSYHTWLWGEPRVLAFVLEAASGFAWLAFLGALLWTVSDAFDRRRRAILLAIAALFFLATVVVVALYATGIAGTWHGAFIGLRLLTIIASAILLENLVRNTAAQDWWSLKFLCIGLGSVLTYDLVLYADGLLFTALNKPLITARGSVYALVVPLLFLATIRRGMWDEQLQVSHKTAFYTTAMAAIGGYLTIMAIAAYYITRLGGTWGPVVQAVFLFGAVITLLLVMASGSSRAFLRVTIAKHLYRYKYDYREEWLRFTRTLSETESRSPIALRITQAIADIVDSTGGALWFRDGERYALAASLYTTATSFSEHDAERLTRFLDKTGWIVDLEDVRRNPEKYQGLTLPDQLQAIERSWIVVPLAHRGELLAIVLLLRPRTPRRLEWEDLDLLKLIGLHAASFLAEHRAMQALVEAQEFERFNRRTAFVIHDIKNIVSELSLFASNIRRHGDNPRFRDDLANAIEGAVARSKRLLERLRDDPGVTARPASHAPVALGPLIDDIARGAPEGVVAISAEASQDGVTVMGDEDRVRALLGHLVRNALEATAERAADGHARVRVSLGASRDRAVVEITDDGPGMDAEFVRDQLFKPFRTTKSGGLGIGAYQCREYARELGGDVEVITSPGSGTTMRVLLPLGQTPGAMTTGPATAA